MQQVAEIPASHLARMREMKGDCTRRVCGSRMSHLARMREMKNNSRARSSQPRNRLISRVCGKTTMKKQNRNINGISSFFTF